MAKPKFKINADHIIVVLLLTALYISAGMIGKGWIWGIALLLAASGIMSIPLYMHLKKSK